MTERITMETIAKHVGVSRVAVSKALRGLSGVSSETREKIRKTASDFGYELQLRESPSKPLLIGVLATSVPQQPYLSRLGDVSYYDSLFWEVERAAKEHNIGVVACSITPGETSMPHAFNRSDIAGALVLGPCNDAVLARMKKAYLPLVTVNHVSDVETITAITTAEATAAAKLTSGLVEQGHRRIGYIGPNGPEWSYSQRWLGFCIAMQKAGLAPAESLVAPMTKLMTVDAQDLEPQFAALPWRTTSAYVLADARLVYTVQKWLADLDPLHSVQHAYASFYHGQILDVPGMSVAHIDLSMLAREALTQLLSISANPKQPHKHIAIYPEIRSA